VGSILVRDVDKVCVLSTHAPGNATGPGQLPCLGSLGEAGEKGSPPASPSLMSRKEADSRDRKP
jgi:hypothetical protein